MASQQAIDRFPHVQLGSDNRWYVSCPLNGGSYDAGTLFPERRFDTEDAARSAALLMRDAFDEGRAFQASAIRTSLNFGKR